MEEYTRDSLRELRRGEQQAQQVRKEKSSKLITFLIVLLFLAAGIFYLATTKPAWLEKHFPFADLKATVQAWTQSLTAPKESEETVDVQAIVDNALKEQDE